MKHELQSGINITECFESRDEIWKDALHVGNNGTDCIYEDAKNNVPYEIQIVEAYKKFKVKSTEIAQKGLQCIDTLDSEAARLCMHDVSSLKYPVIAFTEYSCQSYFTNSRIESPFLH